MSRYDRGGGGGGREYARESRDRDVPSSGSRDPPGFFIPTQQIHREVIQTEICFWLGNDARVKPATKGDQSGYLVMAYRAPTQAMIEDLRKKSAAFGKEVSAKRKTGQSTVTYTQSDTFRDGERIPDASHDNYAQSYPSKRVQYGGYDEEPEQSRVAQYHEPQRQTIQGYPPNYVVAGPMDSYGGPSRRDIAHGSPGIYEPPRQEIPYQPRTPQSMDDTPPISRAAPAVGYVPHSTAPYAAPQPAARGMTQAYRDSNGRTVYVESGYDPRYEAEPGRQMPSSRGRANDHHYSSMR